MIAQEFHEFLINVFQFILEPKAFGKIILVVCHIVMGCDENATTKIKQNEIIHQFRAVEFFTY